MTGANTNYEPFGIIIVIIFSSCHIVEYFEQLVLLFETQPVVYRFNLFKIVSFIHSCYFIKYVNSLNSYRGNGYSFNSYHGNGYSFNSYRGNGYSFNSSNRPLVMKLTPILNSKSTIWLFKLAFTASLCIWYSYKRKIA